MPTYREFNKDAILTEPSLPVVYHSLTTTAQQFAVWGQIETARTLVSLLLSEYSSDWQRKQFRFLKFAFAEANQWPDEIPPEERTEEVLGGIVPNLSAPHGEDPNVAAAWDDATRFETYINHACGTFADAQTGGKAMDRSTCLAEALSAAINLAAAHTSSIEEIEKDAKVQQALDLIAGRIDANCQIGYITERRNIWPLLLSGALARKFQKDPAEMEASGKEVIATFTQRLKEGRKEFAAEGKMILEHLKALEHNTKVNAVKFYEAAGWDMPDTLFNLPPATDEHISKAEEGLGIALPDDYKEFLKISNGFKGHWNGYFIGPPFYGVDEIEWADTEHSILPIQFHEEPTGNLTVPDSIGRDWDDWPGYKKALSIGCVDVDDVWFLPPEETKKVILAYVEAINHPDMPEDKKREVRKLISDKYGSWEAFEKLEWVVMDLFKGDGEALGSFTQCLERRVLDSEKKDTLTD